MKTDAKYDADLAAAAGELLVPIPEAGTDAARMLIANRLLKSQLEAAKQFREQAIHDIEALSRYGASSRFPFCEHAHGEYINREAVLLILREAPTT